MEPDPNSTTTTNTTKPTAEAHQLEIMGSGDGQISWYNDTIATDRGSMPATAYFDFLRPEELNFFEFSNNKKNFIVFTPVCTTPPEWGLGNGYILCLTVRPGALDEAGALCRGGGKPRSKLECYRTNFGRGQRHLPRRFSFAG